MPPPGAWKIPPALAGRLARLGLRGDADLILHLPLRYEDETRCQRIREAPWGASAQIEVEIVEVSQHHQPRRQLVVSARDADGTPLCLRFINFYASQTKTFEQARAAGKRLRVFGELRDGFFGLEMVHPRCRVVAPDAPLPTSLTPIYPATAGLAQEALHKLIGIALQKADLRDSLEERAAWLKEQRLAGFARSLTYLHRPPPDADQSALQERRHPAWRRIKFDEALAQQLSLRRAFLARQRLRAPVLFTASAASAASAAEQAGSPPPATDAAPREPLASALLRTLPFALTPAQARVCAEIDADLARPHPMQRLLQGDVGSGKTIVAALAACRAIDAGWQAALMAPTEILAEQHYQKLSAWLEPLGVRLAWLSGSLKAATKKQMLAATARAADLIVGTHALIQEGVDFSRLGLAIIDEQHRFGVAQRLALRKKGERGAGDGDANQGAPGSVGDSVPHQLMMSATPIPRTLAMSYYADLDVSVIDQLPPGRTPISTRLISAARRAEVIAAVRAAAAAGRQAYWVCPLIEESEKLQLQTALSTHELLAAELAELRVGLVHGRMKSAEKAAVMAGFAGQEIDVLVATTVIEVGVDVPNASLMVIEDAERFGLAQLHQLRGRVGRGAAASQCVLLYGKALSPLARQRLKIIYENSDGFAIAREDLKLRGPGEFIGSRQSGVPLLRYVDLESDADLVELAHAEAERLLNDHPAAVERHLTRWLAGREELLRA